MKFRRFLSCLIFGLGCALGFIGLMAIVLPSFRNPRLQLVLAGFELTASNPLAECINLFVRFVLSHEWPVFCLGLLAACTGAALLLHFSPKPVAPCAKPVSPLPEPALLYSQAEPKPNPFARAVCYQVPAPDNSNTRYSMQMEPILERNTIDDPVPVPAAAEDVQPYFSPRLTFESRAIEAKAGSLSQSGSRILIRAVPEEVPEPQDETYESKPETIVIPPVSIPAAPARPVSPRIRSTMGRHTL